MENVTMEGRHKIRILQQAEKLEWIMSYLIHQRINNLTGCKQTHKQQQKVNYQLASSILTKIPNNTVIPSWKTCSRELKFVKSLIPGISNKDTQSGKQEIREIP